jgi:hypothetical protein
VTHLLDHIKYPRDPQIRHTNEYFDQFGVLVHSGLQHAGDLVFFSRKGFAPTHIGIMISKFQYIHAPGRDESAIGIERLTRKEIPMKEGQIYNVNPIGFKRLAASKGRWKNIM